MLPGSRMLVITILKVQSWQTNGADIVSGRPTYSDVMIGLMLQLTQTLSIKLSYSGLPQRCTV